MATVFEPISPVPPITTIFMFFLRRRMRLGSAHRPLAPPVQYYRLRPGRLNIELHHAAPDQRGSIPEWSASSQGLTALKDFDPVYVGSRVKRPHYRHPRLRAEYAQT